MSHYGIRKDYVARTEALTVSEDASRYWNRQRIASSALYQYYVYEEAARFLESSDSRAFADVGCGYPKKVQELISPVTSTVTLMDHPSMKGLLAEDFPEMTFVPIDLEQADDASLAGKFDCVVCADVVEHLLDPRPLLGLLRRLLRASGRLYLSTPERDLLRGRDCLSSPKLEHVREWNSQEFQNFVSTQDMEIVGHHLLPQKRLRPVEVTFLPILQRILPRSYRSCQLVVCTPIAEP